MSGWAKTRPARFTPFSRVLLSSYGAGESGFPVGVTERGGNRPTEPSEALFEGLHSVVEAAELSGQHLEFVVVDDQAWRFVDVVDEVEPSRLKGQGVTQRTHH